MVAQKLITKGEPVDALPGHFLDRVLDTSRVSVIAEASRKALDEPQPVVRGPQQQATTVGRDVAAVESRHQFVPGRGSET